MQELLQIFSILFPNAKDGAIVLASYLVYGAFWVAVAVLAAAGIHRLAKNRGVPKLWRAWIPFVNLAVLGETVGSAQVFRYRTKKIGVLVAVTAALYAAAAAVGEAAYVWNDAFRFYRLETQEIAGTVYDVLTPTGAGLAFELVSLFLIELPAIVLAFALYLEVFRSYIPGASMALCVITIFFPFVAPVALFFIRNNRYMNYREYLQQRLARIYGAPQSPAPRPKDPFSDFPDPDRDNPYSQRPARPDASGGSGSADPFAEFGDPVPQNEEKRSAESGEGRKDADGGHSDPKDSGGDPPEDDLFH